MSRKVTNHPFSLEFLNESKLLVVRTWLLSSEMFRSNGGDKKKYKHTSCRKMKIYFLLIRCCCLFYCFLPSSRPNSFSLPLFETLRDQTPKQFTLLYLPLNRRWYKLHLGTSTRAFGAIDRDEQCTARTVAHHQTGSR